MKNQPPPRPSLRIRLLYRWRRITRTITPERRAEVQILLRDSSSPDFGFFLLVVMSCVIATLGLLVDSAAIIIGAMLVAPLMSPIIGMGLSSITGNSRLLRDAASALLRGALLAVLISFLITFANRYLPFIVLQSLPQEVLSRTNPGPIDLGVALAGGLAAAFALAMPNISAALPGVAIATALMPPLCTVGIGLAMGRMDVAGGATLLFTTNSVTIAFASSLDHIGPFGRSVRDVAVVLETIAGRDPYDSTSAAVPVEDYVKGLQQDIRGVRVGVPNEYLKGLNPEIGDNIQKAIDLLSKLGCSVVPISLPHTDYAIGCYYIICTAEASSNLARYDGVRYGFRSPEHEDLRDMYRKTRDRGFGAEVKRRIMLGTYVLSSGYYDAYYLKAQKVRTLIARDFLEAFEDVDVIIAPTSPIPAFKLGERVDDPLQMYLADIYTVTASLTGIPGISVPCGKTGGEPRLPVGMQVFGKHFDEARVLQVAYAFEQAGGFEVA